MRNDQVQTFCRFFKNEEGAATIFSMFMLAMTLMMGGLAVDVMNLIQQRQQLQVTADAAAHAALYSRDSMDEEDAIEKALLVAAGNMPDGKYGTVIEDEDVVFGTWDYDTNTFTEVEHSRSAVMVTTRQTAENGNAISTFLLKLAGLTSWSLERQSVFTTYHPPCFREGFVAQDVVDLQSGNTYSNGFCIHSNGYVSLNSNNYFEAGTVVSMPDMTQIDLPQSGMETNEGLEAALRYGRYNIRILNQLPGIIVDLYDPASDEQPDYITSDQVNMLTGNSIEQDDLVPNAVNMMSCSGGNQVNIKSGTEFRNIVFVSNCKLKFESGVSLENAVIATSNTDTKSINSPSGLRLGRDDGCATGGGAQLLTLGGVDVASDLQVYGSQILALKDIQFSANANGVEGASMVSGSTISGTSNMSMGFCGGGMDNSFQAEYFRMVG